MDFILNIINLKSLITFIHLAGLAFGIGGAWILDFFIVKNMNRIMTKEDYSIIEFLSKFVLNGILILWVSGIMFIGYYYLYTPELLSNEKVWGKVVIVTVLTLNGAFVHKIIMPKMKRSIGSTLISSLGDGGIKTMSMIGAVSFVSWLFPMVLGVTKTLNFTVSAIDIVIFYIIVLFIALAVSIMIASLLMKFNHEKPLGHGLTVANR